jgi:hypothetical protein
LCVRRHDKSHKTKANEQHTKKLLCISVLISFFADVNDGKRAMGTCMHRFYMFQYCVVAAALCAGFELELERERARKKNCLKR